MRNGVPSGKTEADVLNDVRTEAFSLRGKSATEDPLDDRDDPLNSSISSVTMSSAISSSLSSSSSSSSSSNSSTSSTIKAEEIWEKWYPTEWIGWITFGPPCPDPTEHCVNETVSDRPKDIAQKKKPFGRVEQRKREIELKAATKVEFDNMSIRSTQMILQQNKYAMALRDDDLRHIQFQLKNSRTEKAKVSIVL